MGPFFSFESSLNELENIANTEINDNGFFALK